MNRVAKHELEGGVALGIDRIDFGHCQSPQRVGAGGKKSNR